MAVEATRVTVSSTPELLIDGTDTDHRSGVAAVLIPVTATAPVFLGGDDTVTDATGAQWDPSLGPLSVEMQRGESLYAVRAPADADQEIHVLSGGK